MNQDFHPFFTDEDIELFQLIVGPVANNVYVVRCRQTGESILIDAANEAEKLLKICSSLNVRSILETHGHWDHIAAVPEIRDAGYSVAVSLQDSKMLEGYDQIIGQGDVITVGRLKIDVIHTPGHTPGSLTFHVRDSRLLFTGDTLFPGGPGATHFPGGDFSTIIDSITNKIFAHFGPETLVFPGHGDSTQVGIESLALESWVARGW